MSLDSKNKRKSLSREEKYLNIFNNYNTDKLSSFIQEEYKDIYDYIFRMVGNCDLAFNTVSKTGEEIVKYYKKLNLNSYPLFKTFLYKTVRSECEAYLNTDTSKLENSGYDHLKKDLGSKKMSEMIFLEKHLQSINSQLKEVLILKYRVRFSSVEIAEILSITQEKESILENQAIDLMKKLTDMNETNIQTTIPTLPYYIYEESKMEETQALSQLIGGLKENSVVPHILHILLKALIFVAIGVGCFYLGRKYK